MKTNYYLPLVVLGSIFTLCGCATSDEDQAVPGTVESTNSKTSENNTPRTNPTPNPEPASNPPGPQSDMRPVTQ